MFHSLTANAIESIFADRLDEFYPILSYHFSRAKDRRARRYARLAGDAAFRIFAIPEAFSHYTQAVGSLNYQLDQAGRDEPTSEELTHLFGRRGRCLEL